MNDVLVDPLQLVTSIQSALLTRQPGVVIAITSDVYQ